MNFEKTEEGRRAIQTRHVKLSPCQRAVLITVNGSQNHSALAVVATAMGGGSADVDALIALGLVTTIAEPQPQPEPQLQPAQNAELDFEDTGGGADADERPSDPEIAAVQTNRANSISIESLWPQSAQAEADANAAETEQFTPTPDFETARSIALDLLRPLGLRTVQLRRTVEAAGNAAQLRDVEPLIRDLLSPDQRQQLDSAFFGLW